MTTLDISPFLEAKSDQITADDLIAGPRTFRIANVEIPGGEQPVSVHMEGMEGRPFKPCKGMRRLLGHLWGPDAAKWIGRSVTLFRDPDVRFGADQTGGVRIAAVSHLDEPQTVPVRVSRGKAKKYNVEPIGEVETRDGARDWADKFIATIGRAPDAGKLENYVASKAATYADLASDRPELHAACEEALARKRASFGAAPDEDDPFADEPSVSDEPESPSQEMLRKIREQIAAAKNAKGLAAVEGEWVNRHRIAFDDATATAVDAEFAARRREMVGGE